MIYKVGDRVKMRSLQWCKENIFNNEDKYPPELFNGIEKFCGKILTISDAVDKSKHVDEGYYNMFEDTKWDYYWTDEMIECKVEEYDLKIGDVVVITNFEKNTDEWSPHYKGEISVIDRIDYPLYYLANDNTTPFTKEQLCVISTVEPDNYVLRGIPYEWTDEMIEGVVNISKLGTAANPVEPKSNANCLTRERVDEPAIKIDKELPSGNPNVWELPDGYQFVDEDGNVINATKIALEKKRKEYPKTYEECYKVLGYGDIEAYCIFHSGADERLFEALYRLKVCRDAYWKIAGEEMGLGKPWTPDWKDGNQKKYCIYNDSGDIQKVACHFANTILAFPTEEMRDAFKENFDPDIDTCKDLL